jgi:hypothetical protein
MVKLSIYHGECKNTISPWQDWVSKLTPELISSGVLKSFSVRAVLILTLKDEKKLVWSNTNPCPVTVLP